MGRKIPGRKHHGVRDPEKQKRKRLAIVKDKINAPPTDPNDQQVPKSLSRLIDLQNKVKTGLISVKRTRKPKKRSKLITIHPRGVKPPKGNEKPTPAYQQRSNESDKQFFHRVSRICHDVIQEAKFEDKYGVDIRRDTVTGEVQVLKRKRDEIEEYHKKVKKESKSKGKKKAKRDENAEPKLTKSQKRAVKLKAKKEKTKQLKLDGFETYKDKVQFGEVVHAPPSLVVPRKASETTDESRKPGKKELLLKTLVKDNKSKVIDKKAKRKDLPTAMRRQLDKQQQEVIQAYKLLKANKHAKELQ